MLVLYGTVSICAHYTSDTETQPTSGNCFMQRSRKKGEFWINAGTIMQQYLDGLHVTKIARIT